MSKSVRSFSLSFVSHVGGINIRRREESFAIYYERWQVSVRSCECGSHLYKMSVMRMHLLLLRTCFCCAGFCCTGFCSHLFVVQLLHKNFRLAFYNTTFCFAACASIAFAAFHRVPFCNTSCYIELCCLSCISDNRGIEKMPVCMSND